MRKNHIWDRIKGMALLLALVCLCSGCAELYSGGYVWETEHKDPYAYKEETEEPTEQTEPELATVSNYYEIMSQLRGFVNNGVQHGQFLAENYDGDLGQELSEAFSAIAAADPIGAYAIERIDYSRVNQGDAWLVTVDAVYRHSVSEIAAIPSVRGNERAMGIIADKLEHFEPSVTLRISGYGETDFPAVIRSYCLAHPNTMIVMPEVSAEVYPDSGNVRVVDLQFRYPEEKEKLQGMQSEAASVLVSAERYAQYAANDKEKLSLIYSYLSSRFFYTEDEENGSVYRLMCEGVGSSQSVASVVAYLCQRVGLECLLVEGAKLRSTDGETGEVQEYLWNIVCIDGQYWHLDFQQDALNRLDSCRMRSDADMEDYRWDREGYPSCPGSSEEPAPEE